MTPRWIRDLSHAEWFQRFAGALGAAYFWFLQKTNRMIFEPEDIRARGKAVAPAIAVFWHGQHFMMPFFPNRELPAKALISRHRDGEIQARVVEALGIGTIRGSGDHGGEFHRKGGVNAFRLMIDALDEGFSVALTADVPKVSRVAGLGVLMLARRTGRTIVPLAITTSRAVQFDNWDHSTVGLPFGRCAVVAGEFLTVPPDADEVEMERLRVELERRIDAANRRAHELVGRKDAGAKHD